MITINALLLLHAGTVVETFCIIMIDSDRCRSPCLELKLICEGLGNNSKGLWELLQEVYLGGSNTK